MKPITAELRLYISGIVDDLSRKQSDRLFELCDAIDAVDASLAEERDELRDENNWLHAELRGWETEAVKLPLDADGVPIRPGETVRERSGNTFEVACLQLFGGADNWLVLSDARSFSTFREPHDITHVRPDSWERIIEDAMGDRTQDPAELVARCRALAGEGE